MNVVIKEDAIRRVSRGSVTPHGTKQRSGTRWKREHMSISYSTKRRGTFAAATSAPSGTSKHKTRPVPPMSMSTFPSLSEVHSRTAQNSVDWCSVALTRNRIPGNLSVTHASVADFFCTKRRKPKPRSVHKRTKPSAIPLPTRAPRAVSDNAKGVRSLYPPLVAATDVSLVEQRDSVTSTIACRSVALPGPAATDVTTLAAIAVWVAVWVDWETTGAGGNTIVQLYTSCLAYDETQRPANRTSIVTYNSNTGDPASEERSTGTTSSKSNVQAVELCVKLPIIFPLELEAATSSTGTMFQSPKNNWSKKNVT